MANPYTEYPADTYVCALGFGDSVASADLNAKAELASLFGIGIRSTISNTIKESSTQRNGNAMNSFSEFFSSESYITVSADNLIGVQIAKRTKDRAGDCVSLAVMERKTTAEYYLSRIQANRSIIDALVTSASLKTGSLTAVLDAVDAVRKANELNLEIAVYRFLSGNVFEYLRISEVRDVYRNAMEALSLIVSVEGDETGVIRTALAKVLTEAGFSVSNDIDKPSACVVATIAWKQSAGTGSAESFVFADYQIDVSMVDLHDGGTLVVLSDRGKEGHQTFDGALARAKKDIEAFLNERLKTALIERFTI